MGAKPVPSASAGLTHCVAVQQKDPVGQTAVLHPQVERVGAVEVDVGLEQSTAWCRQDSAGDPGTAPIHPPTHAPASRLCPEALSWLGVQTQGSQPQALPESAGLCPKQESWTAWRKAASEQHRRLAGTKPNLGKRVPRACPGLRPGPRAQEARTPFPSPGQDVRGHGAAPASTDEPSPSASAPLCTTGAMSRFQRVTLVHAVSRTSGVRCSPSPEMKWEGKEVEICRNWSAKKRGATVVFSLPERKGDSGKQPRRCPAAREEEGNELEDHQPWGGTWMLVTT